MPIADHTLVAIAVILLYNECSYQETAYEIVLVQIDYYYSLLFFFPPDMPNAHNFLLKYFDYFKSCKPFPRFLGGTRHASLFIYYLCFNVHYNHFTKKSFLVNIKKI